MSLSALAIGLQGVGFDPLVLALQGFAPIEVAQTRTGGGRLVEDEDLLRRQVLEKWEVIERARERAIEPQVPADAAPPPPAIAREPLLQPAVLDAAPVLRQAPGPGVDVAGPALMPGALEGLSEDEEALLMLLLADI